jgi:hypothetical protein
MGKMKHEAQRPSADLCKAVFGFGLDQLRLHGYSGTVCLSFDDTDYVAIHWKPGHEPGLSPRDQLEGRAKVLLGPKD